MVGDDLKYSVVCQPDVQIIVKQECAGDLYVILCELVCVSSKQLKKCSGSKPASHGQLTEYIY
jgi:hypothetical protein